MNENELTENEYDTMIEALGEWTSASKTRSMLAGLMMGALVSDSSPELGKMMVDRAMEGENEKQRSREETAALLKAKLIRMRDGMAIKNAMHGIGN